MPSTNYQGADFQERPPRQRCMKIWQGGSFCQRTRAPSLRLCINADEVDNFGNDYFSFCEYPMTASSMAPLLMMYNNRSYTWHKNGRAGARPKTSLISRSRCYSCSPTRAWLSATSAQDPHYDGIAGARTRCSCAMVSLIVSNGANLGCAYGHDEYFLASLDKNKGNEGSFQADPGRVRGSPKECVKRIHARYLLHLYVFAIRGRLAGLYGGN